MVKGLLVLVVFFGFVIQLYVVIEMTWPAIKALLIKNKFSNETHRRKMLFFELIYRIFLVIIAMGFALAIPNLDQIIPLVGVTAGVMLALVFPPLIDSITFLPEMFEKLKESDSKDITMQKLRIFWKIFSNTSLTLLGIFESIAGVQSTIRDLVGQ